MRSICTPSLEHACCRAQEISGRSLDQQLLHVCCLCAGEFWEALEHSRRHTQTVPCICAFSVLGYVTVCLVLLIIKGYGATNAEIVKSLRKVWGRARGELVPCALEMCAARGKSVTAAPHQGLRCRKCC